MLKKLNFLSLLFLVFLFIPAVELSADTLYLKNGRAIEGIVKNEAANTVDLEVCSGVVQFTQSEIERIEKSAPEESQAFLKECQEQARESQASLLKQEAEKERRKEGQVEFSGEGQSIALEVTLNKKVKAQLVLDTGASLVMLRKNIAKELGLDLNKIEPDMDMQLADGRRVKAKHVILDNVKVEDVEAKDVQAAILLDDSGAADFKDGLLGRSFLERFNFKVDYKNKKLTLEKL